MYILNKIYDIAPIKNTRDQLRQLKNIGSQE